MRRIAAEATTTHGGHGGGSDYDARTRGVAVELGKERQGCGRAEHLGCVWLLDKV